MQIKFILPDVHLNEGVSSKLPLLDSYGFSRDVLIQYVVLNHFLGLERTYVDFMEYVAGTLEDLSENGDIEQLSLSDIDTITVSAGTVYGVIMEQLNPHLTTIEDTIRKNIKGDDVVESVDIDHHNRGSTMVVMFSDDKAETTEGTT